MSIFYKIISTNGSISYLFGTPIINSSDTIPLEVHEAFKKSTHFFIDNYKSDYSEILNWYEKKSKPYLNNIPAQYISDISEKMDEDTLDECTEKPKRFILKSPLQLLSSFNDEVFSNQNDSLEVTQNTLKLLFKNIPPDKRKYSGPRVRGDLLFGYNFTILELIELYFYFQTEATKGNHFFNLELMHRAYLEQDIKKLEYSMGLNRILPDDAPSIAKRYSNIINAALPWKFSDQIKSCLNDGQAFIATCGYNLSSAIDKLRSRGYTVEPVSLGAVKVPINQLDDKEIPTNIYDKIGLDSRNNPKNPSTTFKEIAFHQPNRSFKKLYLALYIAQTSILKKTSPLIENPSLSASQIKKYVKENPNSRSAVAWRLAKKYQGNISENNNELIKEICQYGYARSSSFFGIFRQTKTNLDDPVSIANASDDTRTGSVRNYFKNMRELCSL